MGLSNFKGSLKGSIRDLLGGSIRVLQGFLGGSWDLVCTAKRRLTGVITRYRYKHSFCVFAPSY